jgi:hypothetical protein
MPQKSALAPASELPLERSQEGERVRQSERRLAEEQEQQLLW